MPAENSVRHQPKQFLWRQPFWYADHPRPEIRWHLAIREEEPKDEASKLDSAFRPAPIDDEIEDAETRTGGKGDQPKWSRISREKLIEFATCADEPWRRVGLDCGAGLGKTENLKWLEAAINGTQDGRSQHLGVFMNLQELLQDQAEVRDFVVERISNRSGNES